MRTGFLGQKVWRVWLLQWQRQRLFVHSHPALFFVVTRVVAAALSCGTAEAGQAVAVGTAWAAAEAEATGQSRLQTPPLTHCQQQRVRGA